MFWFERCHAFLIDTSNTKEEFNLNYLDYLYDKSRDFHLNGPLSI